MTEETAAQTGLGARELRSMKPQVRLVVPEQGAEHPAGLSPLGLSVLGDASSRARSALGACVNSHRHCSAESIHFRS